MTEQFKEQGGAATMDPGPLRRWLTSRFISGMLRPRRMARVEDRAEQRRAKAGSPHQLEFFYEVGDAYSHLAAQTLRPLLERYGVELVTHLVHGPGGANLPEPDLLPALARYDAALVAPHYGLAYPANAPAPMPALQSKAAQILAAVPANRFPEVSVAVGEALFAGDEHALDGLAQTYGQASATEAAQCQDRGSARQAELKHYSGAMFYYAERWYWGVDRLYHLEQRFLGLGLGGGELIFPRPSIDPGSYKANGSLTLEIYASLRSPYTAVIFDKAVELAEHTGVRLDVRPVLPMVMRGVPATREKGLYILMDATREARALGRDFGDFYDPIGNPARRCYSLLPWAATQGKKNALISAFFQAAFYRGVNTNCDAGMRHVVEEAGLSWNEALTIIDNQDWQEELEENRLSMYGFGSWGVPTFRLLDANGNTIVWAWGQDRLWLIAREIQRLLVQA